jgi:hypothetical protein
MRTAKPGPGNGCRRTISRGEAKLKANLADFVLEGRLSGSTGLAHSWAGPYVVMALDHRGGIAADGNGFDHIRIKRALREKLRPASPFGGALEYLDKSLADAFAFGLRVSHAAKA